MRYFIEIAYNGSNYNGWQVQPNANTVQSEINKALSTIFLQETTSTGCGRTDTGVHAKQFFVHFDTVKPVTKNFNYKMNKLLPKDIVVKNVMPVDTSAHSRFDATKRTYTYNIHFYKDPFLQDYSLFHPYPLPNLKQLKIFKL